MKLSEFKVGDKVIREKAVFFAEIIEDRGADFLLFWPFDNVKTNFEKRSENWLPYEPLQEFKLMAPAIYQSTYGVTKDKFLCSTVLYSSEEEVKKDIKNLACEFVLWPAVIDKETGMYKVPREKK